MRLLLTLACLATVVGAPATRLVADITDFVDYSYSAPGVSLPGRLYVPPEAAVDLSVRRPLVVYLHGGGAVGTNNVTQIEQTPPFLIDEAKRRGAFLYVPQTPTNWATTSILN